MTDPTADRLAALERQVRRQRLMLGALALAGGAALLAAFAPATPAVIEARSVRIVDAAGKPRILLGAPPPVAGRERQDAQTASIVVLGPDGRDRLIVGETPNPRLGGKTYPRVASAYGVTLHDAKGSERGGMTFLDNGRAVIALDRPNADAVAMIVNDQSGFAGVTVNYAGALGQYAEGWRMGTRGDAAYLSLQDRAQGERARLALDGSAAAPRLVTRPAGAPSAP